MTIKEAGVCEAKLKRGFRALLEKGFQNFYRGLYIL